MKNNLEEICGWKEISRKSNGLYVECRKCHGYNVNCENYFILEKGKYLKRSKAYTIRANDYDRSQIERDKQ